MKKIDHTGEKVGSIVVLGKNGKDKHGKILWKGVCSCGLVKSYVWGNLKDQRSCGCIHPHSNKDAQINLTGKKYSKLTVLREWGKTKNGAPKWLCQCDCGKQSIVDARSLKRGQSKSCGCVNQKNLAGKIFTHLLVIKKTGRSQNGCIVWLCRCDCGKTTEVSSNSLLRGNTRSCGCLSRGSKHYNFNQQLTDKERIKRHHVNGVGNWTRRVFERDKHTCQVCNISGCYLHSHHLDSWHWCKEKRFNVQNGVTLCAKCHIKFHKKYGFKFNTSEQFSNFIKGAA